MHGSGSLGSPHPHGMVLYIGRMQAPRPAPPMVWPPDPPVAWLWSWLGSAWSWLGWLVAPELAAWGVPGSAGLPRGDTMGGEEGGCDL